jgi:hypothetical protein
MHAPVQSFCPAGQLAPHETPSQVAVPPVGTTHAVQEKPHVRTSLFETQISLHRCVPAVKQSPMHEFANGMQAPAQRFVPAGQNAPQKRPSHVAPPPVGAGHEKQLSPQWLTSMRDTQIPPQI